LLEAGGGVIAPCKEETTGKKARSDRNREGHLQETYLKNVFDLVQRGLTKLGGGPGVQSVEKNHGKIPPFCKGKIRKKENGTSSS